MTNVEYLPSNDVLFGLWGGSHIAEALLDLVTYGTAGAEASTCALAGPTGTAYSWMHRAMLG